MEEHIWCTTGRSLARGEGEDSDVRISARRTDISHGIVLRLEITHVLRTWVRESLEISSDIGKRFLVREIGDATIVVFGILASHRGQKLE